MGTQTQTLLRLKQRSSDPDGFGARNAQGERLYHRRDRLRYKAELGDTFALEDVKSNGQYFVRHLKSGNWSLLDATRFEPL